MLAWTPVLIGFRNKITSLNDIFVYLHATSNKKKLDIIEKQSNKRLICAYHGKVYDVICNGEAADPHYYHDYIDTV